VRKLILFRIRALAFAYLRNRDRFFGRKVSGLGLAPLKSTLCEVWAGLGPGFHPELRSRCSSGRSLVHRALGLQAGCGLGRFHFGWVNHSGLQKTQT
jgi:hypothetical protein